MKISPITINTLKYNIPKRKSTNMGSNPINRSINSLMPTTEMILSFQGGKSLNLAQTVQQIDKNGEFPPDIKDLCLEELRKNPNTQKTLIDIHKAKYEKLLDCKSIDEVRQLFPEFKNVQSDKDILYPKNSFIDQFKNGEIPHLDRNKDLSLQLIQMYWAKGISLHEFRKEIVNKNVHNTFRKLNIPMYNQLYAQYLHLSDPDNNNHFGEQISARWKDVEKRDETRKKISESLKKYYAENPDSSLLVSENKKKYFENNPDAKNIFSQVLLRAWDYPEAKPVRKALSKFMKKKDINPTEILDLAFGKHPNKMQIFWDRNQWAHSQWSKAMTKSWERQSFLAEFNIIYEPLVCIRITPKKIRDRMKKELGTKYDEVKKYQYTVIPDPRDKNMLCAIKGIESTYLINTYFANHPEEYKYTKELPSYALFNALLQISKKLKNGDEEDFKHILSNIFKGIKEDQSSLDALMETIMYTIETAHKDWEDMLKESIEVTDNVLRHNQKKPREIDIEFTKLGMKYGFGLF